MGALEVVDDFRPSLMLNADIDTMGRTVENEVVNEIKIASREAELESVCEELRIQLLHRERAHRELEFLENRGDPLDFRFGHISSASVQSTSLTGQHQEQIATSKAKSDMSLFGTIAHSDEPSLRQRKKVCDANTVDNIVPFDGKDQPADVVENNSINLNINRNLASSEQSSRVEGTYDGKESEESTIVRPYARRNRSKPNHNVSRSASTDVIPSRVSVHVPVPSRFGLKDTKGSLFDSNHIDQKISSRLDNCTRSSPDKTHLVIDVPNFDSRCSSNVETVAGLPKGSSDEGSLNVLTYVVPLDVQNDPVHFVDANRALNDESIEIIVGKADLLSNGCLHSENANRKDEVSAIVAETKSRCVQGNSQGEAESNASAVPVKTSNSEYCTRDNLNDGNTCPISENVVLKQPCVTKKYEITEEGMIKSADERDTGQIAFDSNKSDLQNNFDHNFEVRVPKTSEMDTEFQAGDRISAVSSGTELNNPVVSGISFVQGNIAVSDATLEIGGSATAETIVHEISLANSFSKSYADAPKPETGCTKELQKVDEDSILAEALLVEAKRKRISQLLTRTLQSEKQPKSHWDFVLEEMAWSANDFMQERLWKISAAAQFGHRAALASFQRVEEKMPIIKLKAVAQSNARAVLKFWKSVESFKYTDDRKTSVCDKSLLPFNTNDAVEDQTEESQVVKEPNSEVEQHGLTKYHAIKEYAARFLKYNATAIPDLDADSQLSPGLKYSLVAKEEEIIPKPNLTDESLFYEVPAGAMESYRNAIESHVLQCEVSDGGLQEAERSLYDATDEHMYMGEEEEQDTYYLPSAFEGSQASKTAERKRKNLSNAYVSGMYDVGDDLTFGRHRNGFYARPIPKKRSRIASQQRLPSPYDIGIGGNRQLSDRIDASSEDTDSFQDDQIEYAIKTEKHLLLDVEGDLSKIKKNKYPKYLNSSEKQRRHLNTALPDGQKDIFKKRTDNQQLKCNGVDGTIGQPNAKRSKILKQAMESSFESPGLNKGTVPSAVASQMNKMPHPSQIMKMIGVRDQARKAKSLKGPSGKSGSGNLWSSIEDQALVVLVHDLGPNWNLVSDAMNSALQFVYIFRKPNECMERHKILMDKTTDDGADSAEDSGSSQPYPSTLPGIPKGSARQLFQRLQGPMEDDTLKSHFEKIMFIRRKQHYRKIRNDAHDYKQVVPVHNSHVIALSEVSSNYLNGGYLTPLELCDLPLSNLDSVTLGHQGTQPVGPPPAENSSYQGTLGLFTGCNSPHAMGPLSAPVRDSTHGTFRQSTLTSEQQKCNPMSTQQSSLSVSETPSVTDRSTVRMVPGANSSGMASGLNNQSLPISRHGFQGTNLSPIPIAGGMPSSGMIGMQNHVNPRVNSSQGTSTSNFSGAYTTLNQERQRQMIAPELHIRATQWNNHGTTPSREIGSTFTGHNSTPMGQLHPVQNQPQHHPRVRGTSVLQHPAYARLVKERHLQQQLLLQQQSSALIPIRPMSQSPMLPQTTQLGAVLLSPSPVTLASQPQQKHLLPPQGLNPTQTGSSGVINQTGTQGRQSSHPFQQSARSSHPHHPQQAQPQPLAKLSNGVGAENISTSQNGTDNSSHLSRISSAAGATDQLASVHGGSSYSGSNSIPAQPFRPQAPQSFGHTFQQKRLHSSVPPTNTAQKTLPNSDNGSQNERLPRTSAHRSSVLHSAKSAGGNPQLNMKFTSLQKNGNETLDNTEKKQQQNLLENTDQLSKDLTDPDRSGEQIMNNIPSSDTPAALPHGTGFTGRASVNSSSSILLRTESELYDLVLQNFDSQMNTAGKPTQKPFAIKPDPTINEGPLLQRQLSSGMNPSQDKSSQHPDTHCAELKGTLSTQPTIK